MSFVQEIRSKIHSIKSTQKITRAMEMVAASKMRKAQERMNLSRPYAHRIQEVVTHIACSHSEYKHPYLCVRPITRVGFIVVTTDRGLCGSLNSNLLKTVLATMKDYARQSIAIDLSLLGRRGEAFFKRLGGHVVAHAEHLGDAPKLNDVLGVVTSMLELYRQKQLDRLFLAHNQCVNTMLQQPILLQLLPILPSTYSKKYYWDYLYEPDAKSLLELVFNRYIEASVYQGVLENIACEQASRMIAMKNATENAGALISELQLTYNKLRQAAITKELAEIVAGSDAL